MIDAIWLKKKPIRYLSLMIPSIYA